MCGVSGKMYLELHLVTESIKTVATDGETVDGDDLLPCLEITATAYIWKPFDKSLFVKYRWRGPRDPRPSHVKAAHSPCPSVAPCARCTGSLRPQEEAFRQIASRRKSQGSVAVSVGSRV